MSKPPSASVAYRLPVVAAVSRAQALAGFGVNHDALSVSPKMPQRQLVSFGTKNIHCIGREPVFDENLIGHPLMMKPGRIDGFLNVEREIDDADEDVGDGGDDGGASGRTEDEEELAIFKNDGRSHSGERALAGANGIGGTLNEAVGIGDAGFGGEVVHFVVEQKAQAFGGGAGAEGVVERGGDGNSVAFGVDDGIMRCVLRLANRDWAQLRFALEFGENSGAFQYLAQGGLIGIDGVAPGRGVFFVD